MDGTFKKGQATRSGLITTIPWHLEKYGNKKSGIGKGKKSAARLSKNITIPTTHLIQTLHINKNTFLLLSQLFSSAVKSTRTEMQERISELKGVKTPTIFLYITINVGAWVERQD